MKLGREAVKYLNNKPDHPVFLITEKCDGDFIIRYYGIANLNNIEYFHRYVNGEFYNSDILNATDSARQYLSTMNSAYLDEKYGFE